MLIGIHACNNPHSDSKKNDTLDFSKESQPHTATPISKITEPEQTSKIQPEAVVKEFYQAVTENNCTKATSLRPAYPEKKCADISKAAIKSIRTELNDGKNAVIYLNLDYSKKKNTDNFNGFLWLKKNKDTWEIQEDFESVGDMGIDDFISRYINTNSSIGEQQLNTDNPIPQKDIVNNNHKQLLTTLRKRFKRQAKEKIILVDVSDQKMFFYNKVDKLIGSYPISTATKGVGNQAGSDKTPLGAHRISDKYGNGAKIGSIFVSRQNTGRVAKIIKKPLDVKEDYVTTRILWLDGLEPGKNKGGNVDSHNRYIYIHGTPEEGLIGTPASHGCIRMVNTDVINIFKQSPKNTLVYIGE